MYIYIHKCVCGCVGLFYSREYLLTSLFVGKGVIEFYFVPTTKALSGVGGCIADVQLDYR